MMLMLLMNDDTDVNNVDPDANDINDADAERVTHVRAYSRPLDVNFLHCDFYLLCQHTNRNHFPPLLTLVFGRIRQKSLFGFDPPP